MRFAGSLPEIHASKDDDPYLHDQVIVRNERYRASCVCCSGSALPMQLSGYIERNEFLKLAELTITLTTDRVHIFE